MRTRPHPTPRLGALPPRYSFLLNPYPHERFTRCPRCKSTTRLRKIPLVVHVDSLGLVLLRKSCRLCTVCEVLIAHETEVRRVIKGLGSQTGACAEYVILGTLGSDTWRDGMRAGVTIEDVRTDMADFKAYLRVQITPRHWGLKDTATD